MDVYTWHWGPLAKTFFPEENNEYYIFWVCVFSPSYPACMRHTSVCGLSGSNTFFATLFHKRHDFRRKIELRMCVLIFSATLTGILFLILKRIQRDDIINVRKFSYKVPFLLSAFGKTWIFSTDFRKKNTQILNLIKIHPVTAELFNVEGRTDERTDGRTDGRTNGRTKGRTNGRTKGRTDERTDGWT